jgi:hypothetical protein
MTTKTRYFVIVSLLVIGVGLGTGLVAYYVGGLPAGAFAGRGGPEELGFIPRDATVIAYANVHEVMTSELRQKMHHALPMDESGQRELQNETGINIETDVDRIVACLRGDHDSADHQGITAPGGMVLARGRFDEVKIEALMREHGAHVEDYKGKRLIVGETPQVHAQSFALSFIEPGLAAFGSMKLIRTAIDLHNGGANPQIGLESVTSNDELMTQVRSLESGNNAWAVGRFDVLTSEAHLPDSVASRLPALTWFSVGGHVNGGLRAVIRAEARDDDAANNLRDVVRGFMALAKLQSGSKPEMQAMMQSLELGGTGKTVSLSFVVPAEVFDIVGSAAGHAMKPQGHQ